MRIISEKFSDMGMAMTEEVDPSNAKASIGKSSRLHFGLVIKDHIESIGKANTIKRG